MELRGLESHNRGGNQTQDDAVQECGACADRTSDDAGYYEYQGAQHRSRNGHCVKVGLDPCAKQSERDD
jgi:hypothetical protein